MKRIIVILICAIHSLSLFSQQHFFAVNGKLVWQKVYTASHTEESIINALYNSGAVTDINAAGGIITCKIPATPIDYEAAGFIRGLTPMYMLANDLSAFASIQVKDGRYRVTVENFYLTSTSQDSLSSIGEKISLNFYAIKNGQMSRQVAKAIEPIIGLQLDTIFSLESKAILNDDNW